MKKLKLLSTGIVLATTIIGFNGSALAQQTDIQSDLQLKSANYNKTETKLTTKKGNIIEFGMPRLQPKNNLKSQYSGLNPKTLDSKIKKVDDGIEQTIIIEPSSSNSTIEIPFEFQNGEYIKLAEDKHGNKSGAGNIFNKENESIALLSTPLVDGEKNGKIAADIKNGNILELSLESEQISQPTTMTVTATATSYSTYFNSGSWITRDGMVSLSMNHKPYLTGAAGDFESITRKLDSWDKLYAKHSGSSKWKNTGGMKDQYNCHFDTIGSYKNPWNLEPSRPDVSYAATIAAACNPK
ncbi:DUF2599 domain-containing protein [Peribacillus frigoritolerans]|uniref:DUF2599 domain-containing protein n=1 Tax=Peribacillus frigoritolerans TaxID=450367 RepID=UPI0024C0458C|nr:DUF2599 domain-containing protein [Peribacillus frigoritolerans]WHY15765.1 DUF2599 domain-containing protein [Peribacillus frigoritolerans]